MPPKSRGSEVKGKGREPPYATPPRSRNGKRTGRSPAVADVFRDMVAEATASDASEGERPRKRRKKAGELLSASATKATHELNKEDDVDEESLEFEDVTPLKPQRALSHDSVEDSEDSLFEEEPEFEDVEPTTYDLQPEENEEDDALDLNLTAGDQQRRKAVPNRRKPLTNAERELRLKVHKMHILCLLSYVNRRNNWCNDSEVQNTLRPFFTKQMENLLKGRKNAAQSLNAQSFKEGLNLVVAKWQAKFQITAKGMSRPYWFDSEEDIKNFELHPDADILSEKAEFRQAARTLQGSRDVGAQLFCALFRGFGLDVRLVCSLQPLPFSGSVRNSLPAREPIHPREVSRTATPEPANGGHAEPLDSTAITKESLSPDLFADPRRRLGHPLAADHVLPSIHTPSPTKTPSRTPPRPKRKRIIESPYPVFWIEVLNAPIQKWTPIDPMSLESIAKPRIFEPPASDPENNLSYVIAFSDDGAAKDVTRRYAKAYNAKTRKVRVEATEGGEKWWDRAMRWFDRGWTTDGDAIEDLELAQAEAREPMPKAVGDFRGHRMFVLERHLRRNELLVPGAREVGKVAVGLEAGGGRWGEGKKKRLESVFRRRDVRSVKSADGWYRLGREVKPAEQPVKVVAARTRREQEDIDGDGEAEERAGTALYTIEQTDLYIPPPVVSGRVPRNAYGNLDVYVPSMVPAGGMHVSHPDTAKAARLLGIDYADAVTGFEFKGKHGHPTIRGAVVAEEFRDAVETVIEGFHDAEAEAEAERRSLIALGMWRRFLVGLRIKERVDGYEAEGEEVDKEVARQVDAFGKEEDANDYGGGFLPSEATMERVEFGDGDYAGGFMPQSANAVAVPVGNASEDGGFVPGNDHNEDGRGFLSNDLDGGGFVPEDDGMEGGFVPPDGDGGGGGFVPDDDDDAAQGGAIPEDDDSGMETEEYVDDGEGGYLTD
jgi:xeroderma pigmentosum group C-complementing protein